MSSIARSIVVAAAALACGCGPAEQPAPAVAPRPAASDDSSSPLDAFPTAPGAARYKRVMSKRMQLSIPLPDREGWVMVRDASSFLVLEHAATSSRLAVRVWREDDTTSRAGCEESVRRSRQVPERAHSIDSRAVDVPAGFDTHADVGLGDGGPSAPISGYLLAFGASARRCFALVYTTAAEGTRAEQVVGDRLAVMQTLSLEGIRLKSDLDLSLPR